jgi:hypothetical protein
MIQVSEATGKIVQAGSQQRSEVEGMFRLAAVVALPKKSARNSNKEWTRPVSSRQ